MELVGESGASGRPDRNRAREEKKVVQRRVTAALRRSDVQPAGRGEIHNKCDRGAGEGGE